MVEATARELIKEWDNRWESWDVVRLARLDMDNILTSLQEDENNSGAWDDDNLCQKFLDYFVQNNNGDGEYIPVEATFRCGYDHSVGIDEFCDFEDDADEPEWAYQIVNDCPFINDIQKQELNQAIKTAFEELNEYDFKLQ